MKTKQPEREETIKEIIKLIKHGDWGEPKKLLKGVSNPRNWSRDIKVRKMMRYEIVTELHDLLQGDEDWCACGNLARYESEFCEDCI